MFHMTYFNVFDDLSSLAVSTSTFHVKKSYSKNEKSSITNGILLRSKVLRSKQVFDQNVDKK
jgi:hypothetical protein